MPVASGLARETGCLLFSWGCLQDNNDLQGFYSRKTFEVYVQLASFVSLSVIYLFAIGRYFCFSRINEFLNNFDHTICVQFGKLQFC